MRGDNSTSEIPYKQHIEDLNGEITHLQNAVKNNTGDNLPAEIPHKTRLKRVNKAICYLWCLIIQ